jgi:hypothetical protein
MVYSNNIYSVTGWPCTCRGRQLLPLRLYPSRRVILGYRNSQNIYHVTGWSCTCLGRQLLPLRVYPSRRVSWVHICSAWVWPPGDAWQIARALVSCDSSVCKGLMIDRACLRMLRGYLGIMLGLVRRPGQEFHSGYRVCISVLLDHLYRNATVFRILETSWNCLWNAMASWPRKGIEWCTLN